MEQSTPFVLSGLSIGVAVASHIINTAELGVDGFIALAPASPGSSDFSELVEATSEILALIIAGEQDSRGNRYATLKAELSIRPNGDFQLISGLDHSNPEDLNQGVRAYLYSLT